MAHSFLLHWYSRIMHVGSPESRYFTMRKQPDNMYWLQNNNDRQQQQMRPGRPGGQTPQQRPSSSLNRWLLLIVGILLIVYVVNWFNSANQSNNAPQQTELSYTQFYNQINNENVKSATLVGQTDITGTLKTAVGGHTQYHVYQLPNGDPELPQKLIASGATVNYQAPPDNTFWLSMLINFLPWIFLIGAIFFFSRRATQGQQGIFSFGKSRAKLILEDRPSTTFADVAGVDESKYELQEVVEFLKTPQKFQRLGGKIPRGVLLVGPPGTGKTLLARAVAGEAGVPFFSMSGSEFVEVLVGVGASRVRDLFDQAKKASPSIIFIDEIDAVGRQRGSSINTNDEREQTLNQLLVEMDGFDTRQAVVVIAATNRPDGLDQALLRPGRFDRRVTVDRPDWNGRLAILKIHSRNVPLAPDVDLVAISRSTPGMVGADLANLVNEAALLAARRNQDRVTALARQIVTRWGMSEKLGTISYSERGSPFTGGGEAGAPSDYSETTAEAIDDEVDRIVRTCHARAVELLETHRPTLDRIADELRRQEVIDSKQLQEIMQETGAVIASPQSLPQGIPRVITPPPGTVSLRPEVE